MNAVMKLKKKYSCPRNAEICDIINEYISTTDSSIEENETRLSEDRRKIEELSRDLVVVKNKLQTEKLIVNNKTKDLKSENEKLKSLEIEKNRMAKNNYIQERQCHKLRTRKPSSKDQTILNLGQRKLDLCKQLTRIRWDYGAMDVAIKGSLLSRYRQEELHLRVPLLERYWEGRIIRSTLERNPAIDSKEVRQRGRQGEQYVE